MSSIVIFAAIADEIIPNSIKGIDVIYTGIGKVNAAFWATKIILDRKPKLLLNVGTAGVLANKNLGKVHEVRSVIE